MSLWWLQPGWTNTRCACGATIYPEGDPDWGSCISCFEVSLPSAQECPSAPPCDVCGGTYSVAATNGKNVCSQECSDIAADTEAPHE
jgi:hypothetical protein